MTASAAEILRYIAAREPLALSASRFSLPRADLARLLTDAADRLGGVAPSSAVSSPPPSLPSAPLPTAQVPVRSVPPRQPVTVEPSAETSSPLRRAKVFSDGASRGNPGPAGAGAVIIDPATGKVVERLKRFLGQQTNNVAEYEGVILGLRRALELGIREVEVVADSQLVIRQLGGRYKVKNAGLRPLYELALQLLKEFDRVRLVHVPREMNTLADEMSNRAIDEK